VRKRRRTCTTAAGEEACYVHAVPGTTTASDGRRRRVVALHNGRAPVYPLSQGGWDTGARRGLLGEGRALTGDHGGSPDHQCGTAGGGQHVRARLLTCGAVAPGLQPGLQTVRLRLHPCPRGQGLLEPRHTGLGRPVRPRAKPPLTAARPPPHDGGHGWLHGATAPVATAPQRAEAGECPAPLDAGPGVDNGMASGHGRLTCHDPGGGATAAANTRAPATR
jgi:hypothetical protein